MNGKKVAYGLWGIVVVCLVFSGIFTQDRWTWFLEVVPILLGLPLLWFMRQRFPLTPLLLGLLAAHALILIVGGYYTYAKVPLGFWMQDWFGFSRNHFDRIGHFAQGFVPAILTREILLRCSLLQPGRWLSFLVVCVCLSFSACYEFFEWGVAVATGEAADAFLGSQGDVWDTQWDMFLALIGAIVALTVLSRLHTRALLRLLGPSAFAKRPE